MPGFLRQGDGKWLAYGKHPLARDFFSVGDEIPIGGAFVNWIERGVRGLPEQRDALAAPLSWRFWSQSGKAEYLSCGLIKNSFDGIKRVYPLLIMGAGRAPLWQDHWELVPLLFEDVWGRIESFTAQNFSGVDQFREGLKRLKFPVRKWSELNQYANSCQFGNFPAGLLTALRKTGYTLVSIDLKAGIDTTLAAVSLHSELRKTMGAPPSTVFVGGGLERSYIAIFYRPLQEIDFGCLWCPAKNFDFSLDFNART